MCNMFDSEYKINKQLSLDNVVSETLKWIQQEQFENRDSERKFYCI